MNGTNAGALGRHDGDTMTLAELIASEPANAGRTDAEVLAWLNGTVPVFRDVSWLDLSMWIAENDLRQVIASRVGDADAATSTAAQHIVDCIVAGQPLAASDFRVRTTIAKAMPAGAARDALLALATTQTTRWSTVMREMDDASKLYYIAEARV